MNVDRVAKVERAIKQKYGEEYITNIKSLFTPEIDALYRKQIKKIKIKNKKQPKKKTLSCPMCDRYIYTKTDKYYLYKYEACEECYINNIQ